MERFKTNLTGLLDKINLDESEEHYKTPLIEFLRKTYYDPQRYINTKARTDLVIHNGATAKSPVGVLIEVKRPANRAEMVAVGQLNAKALQELLLYYLRERIGEENFELRHLIITNLEEWFIFDAVVFERLFAQDKKLDSQFRDFENRRLSESKTEFFYESIASPAIARVAEKMEYTHFSLKPYEKLLRSTDKSGDTKLIALYKLLSPEHLLKLPFQNDSNSLDTNFYRELLHIIGLKETKEGGKKLIGRSPEGERHTGSILEDAILQLDSLEKLSRMEQASQYGRTAQERLFNVALELTITWVNRILFLKLLEAQLITYHRGDRSYAFLNTSKIKNYGDLNSLFFQVLARVPEDRNPDVKIPFALVPYLNSSLFEPTELEDKAIVISNLKDDKTLPVYSSSVLKNEQGRRRTGEIRTLAYLFDFLNAYDFSSEGAEDIQEDNKTLINASVLGLIFEKINGYKDGSFFTPGFITMYMCRETIRKTVVDKFNAYKGWSCNTLNNVYDCIEDTREANEIVNSIRICDPAVGSGHFLVSALNEMLAVKNELRILQDRQGQRLKEYTIEVVNDELIVTDEQGGLFEYHPGSRESQRVQEALFHEKLTLIENCLFGVDINPNSVKICRLRLWIELLKHAYYHPATEIGGQPALETLPNIDINIKRGNSLVSRFPIDIDLRQALKKSKWTIKTYRLLIETYQSATTKEEKWGVKKTIEKIRNDFSVELKGLHPEQQKLKKLKGDLEREQTQYEAFGDKNTIGSRLIRIKIAKTALEKQQKVVEEIESQAIFENAFEWRFEFPEVLNDEGEFEGFDVVIGNPPYIRQEAFSDLKPYLKNHYAVYTGTADLYTYFVELGMTLLRDSGNFSFIIPNKWMRASYGKNLRRFIRQFRITQALDFGDLPVFEEATTYPFILQLEKTNPLTIFTAANIQTLDFPEGLSAYVRNTKMEVLTDGLEDDGWNLADSSVQQLLLKLKTKGVPLESYVYGKIFYGIKTGLNEAFVIDEATKDKLIAEDASSEAIIKPFLAGRDVKRYQNPTPNKYLIFTRRGIKIERYPAILRYLEQFKERLMPKPKDYNKPKWPGRKKGSYEWYEVQDSIDYYEEFEKDKIIIPAIVKGASYAFDTEKSYSNDKTTIIPLSDLYLLGLLNSKAVDFYLKSISSTKQNGYFEYKPQYIAKLPIIRANKAEKLKVEELVGDILSLKNQNPSADTSSHEAQIDLLVYKLYDLTAEEIALIEAL